MLNAQVERLPAVAHGRIGELYLQHADGAVRLAYLLTGDRELAEDLVQDAFVRLAGRLAHLREPAAFEAYLRETVVNLSRSYFRRRKVERTYLARMKERPIQQDVVPAESIDDREVLWRALGRLSTRQRTAVVLRFYEDLSEARVAEIMRVRPGTVKSLVSRGLETLRNEIRGGNDEQI